ncbi:54S ribosomal protein L9, mitochondrial [Nowakowskiella sp. JEL0078]|nr:54S ribosomal protein L9, mitochondrial [Nowakowskiella sp. JEL0078]
MNILKYLQKPCFLIKSKISSHASFSTSRINFARVRHTVPETLPIRAARLARKNAPPPPKPILPYFSPTSDQHKANEWTSQSVRTGLLAIKRGMTVTWDEWGKITPVTVLQVVDCEVVQTRWDAGVQKYSVQVGAVNQKILHRVRRPQLFHYRKFMVEPKKTLCEFKITPDAYLPSGVKLNAAHFVPGQFVDCKANAYVLVIGKGFQGVMKLHGFKGLPASHGTSLAHRSAGSTGMNTTPGRVFPGKKMAGRMGGKPKTIQNLRVMRIDPHNNLIFVKGGVPGPDDKVVKVIDAKKKQWYGEVFPLNSEGKRVKIPFPTFLGNPLELERELVPEVLELKGRDPFSRAKREKE